MKQSNKINLVISKIILSSKIKLINVWQFSREAIEFSINNEDALAIIRKELDTTMTGAINMLARNSKSLTNYLVVRDIAKLMGVEPQSILSQTNSNNKNE